MKVLMDCQVQDPQVLFMAVAMPSAMARRCRRAV
jgi:hypothetical protein